MKKGHDLTADKEQLQLKAVDNYLIDADIGIIAVCMYKKKLINGGEFWDDVRFYRQFFDAHRPIEDLKKIFLPILMLMLYVLVMMSMNLTWNEKESKMPIYMQSSVGISPCQYVINYIYKQN